MADETAHARDAFALASAYAGRNLARPRSRWATHSSAAVRWRSCKTAILEGCIGETVAAVEASEALANATEPAVRAALARISTDEARHAELAWRFVSWVLREGPESLREDATISLGAIVDLAVGETKVSTPTPHDFASIAREARLRSQGGMLSSSERTELRSGVLTEVVAPCARALLAAARRRRDRLTFASTAAGGSSIAVGVRSNGAGKLS